MIRPVIAVLFGLVLATLGLALAANFRGIATRHVSASVKVTHMLRRDLRVRRWPASTADRTSLWFVRYERVFGGLMIIMGAVAIVGGVYIWST